MPVKPIHNADELGKIQKGGRAGDRRTHAMHPPGRRTGMTLIEEMIEERLDRDAEEQRILNRG